MAGFAKQFGDSVKNWSPPPLPSSESLLGTYAVLEPLDANSHAADLYHANSEDDAIWDYLPYGPFASAQAYHDWAHVMAQGTDPLFYALRARESGRCCGVLSYLRIAPEAGSIEVGHINFAPELQRTRAATEAVFLMMNWAFEAGYRRFEWKCDALNIASRRAAQRFGFSYEGVFRQATVYKGRNRDTAWFACIDKDWPALKAAYLAWLAPQNFTDAGLQIKRLGELTRQARVSDDPALVEG